MSYTPSLVIAPTVITTADARYSQAGRVTSGMSIARAGAGAFTVSRAIYVPIEVPTACTLAQLFTWNGTVAAGNIDIGIYNAAGTRLISATPTAMSGTATLQFFNVADTPLSAGLHYLALAVSDGTATFDVMNGPNVGFPKAAGCYSQASAGTLPSPATFSTCLDTFVPVIGFTTLATL